MPGLEDVKRFLSDETGLATISTVQADGRVLSSIANCGVVKHPVTGTACVALVSRGGAARLAHIRRGSQVTIAIRRGWNWISVTGPAELIGPTDPANDVDPETLRVLLRDIFIAAGGTHDDFAEYDRAMAADERTAVLVSPERIIGNTPDTT